MMEDAHTRRIWIHGFIRARLDTAMREAKAMNSVGTAMQVITATKDAARAESNDVPQAALTWGLVCVLLEIRPKAWSTGR